MRDSGSYKQVLPGRAGRKRETVFLSRRGTIDDSSTLRAICTVQLLLPYRIPSFWTVRTLLRVLEEKDQLRHEQEGPRYVYEPTRPREKVRRSALSHMLETFFDGSTEQAIAALLDVSSTNLSDDSFSRLSDLIEQARREGR